MEPADDKILEQELREWRGGEEKKYAISKLPWTHFVNVDWNKYLKDWYELNVDFLIDTDISPLYVISEPSVDENTEIPLTMYHIIPGITLLKFFDTALEENGKDNNEIAGLVYVLGTIANMFEEYAARRQIYDTLEERVRHQLRDIRLTQLYYQKHHEKSTDTHNPLFEARELAVSIFYWMPGNLFLGPENRADGPKNEFEKHAYIVMQNEKAFALLKRIDHMMNLYIKERHVTYFNNAIEMVDQYLSLISLKVKDETDDVYSLEPYPFDKSLWKVDDSGQFYLTEELKEEQLNDADWWHYLKDEMIAEVGSLMYPLKSNEHKDAIPEPMVDEDTKIPLSRHHIIPGNILYKFFNTALNENDKNNTELTGLIHILDLLADSFERYYEKQNNHYSFFWSKENKKLKMLKHVLHELKKFGAPQSPDQNRSERNLEWFKATSLARAIFFWMPGNIFIGPKNRGDDPKDLFEVNARHVIRDENTFRILRKIYEYMNMYLEKNEVIYFNSVILLLEQHISLGNIEPYSFRKEQWYVY